MNILVLGSQGFIGSVLAKYFVERNHQVEGCDLVEAAPKEYIYRKLSILSSDFELIFTDTKFDICINASGSGNVSYSVSYPLSDFEANGLAVIRVLDILRKFQPSCKYFHISSAAIYGNPVHLPVSEKSRTTPLSPYGYHKWISEIVCQEYNRIYGLRVAIARPFSVYGKGLRKQLFWDICSLLRTQDSIQLSGSGQESRDFIHVSDLARCFELIMDHGKFDGEAYNIGSGNETTIKSIANEFENSFGGQKRISFSGKLRAEDPTNWRADISKLLALGFVQTVPLTDGIKDYIHWFEKVNARGL